MMKKRIIILIGSTIIALNTFAQSVGINDDNSTPDSSAMLDVKSSTKGILIPRLDFNNKPESPVNGLIIYVTANGPEGNNTFYYYNGSAWAKVAGSVGTDSAWTISGNDMYSSIPGNIGIGTTTPAQKLTVAGTIESTSGGIKFPDGTTQTSAAETGGTSVFRVHKNDIDQTINYNLYTKVDWNTIEFDTNNDFDLANDWVKPTIAGVYLLNGNITISGINDASYIIIAIFKNGSVYSVNAQYSSINAATVRANLTEIVSADGVNDYFELFVYHKSGTTELLSGNSINTSFSGAKLD